VNIGESNAANVLLELLTGKLVPNTRDDWQTVADAGGLLARHASKTLRAGLSERAFREAFEQLLQPADPLDTLEWTLDLQLPRRLVCHVCGCTSDDDCQLLEGPCSWVHEPGQPALCSGCTEAGDEELAEPTDQAPAPTRLPA
jgi:hypothetical protein